MWIAQTVCSLRLTPCLDVVGNGMKTLVGLGVLMALLYVGNDLYQAHQSENKFRAELKAVKMTPYMLESIQGAPFKQRIDNQYPNITYVTEFDKDATLVSDVKEQLKSTATGELCAPLLDVDLKFNRDRRKAAIAVVEKDNVRTAVLVKHGDDTIFKADTYLKDCVVMTQLKSIY